MAIRYTQAREQMIREQLVKRGLTDPLILAAMGQVPRHLFVAESLRDRAYEDSPLPIGEDQTISQPYMIALMAETLKLAEGEKVLEVGTGSGYLSAVLAEQGVQVCSVELSARLAERARVTLQALGYDNVRVHVGDGTLGWPVEAPFDAIVVGAAAPCLPRPLLDQLRLGGRLVVPMGEEELQTLVRVWKEPQGLREEYFGECRFVKLSGAYGWESYLSTQ
ncbi:MAG: protein-L-isoaspartate(D-aspartate) O-methyltransferase [Deltaproteobacteria bacterium]|nr:protein-L-isoaspartate(D-aspartate) O-methyltransferase [Deltaproteobacteria bacterium]